ncbi:MAG: biopolymer transporter ExbD [Paludibacteraceae bacterium]|nr:biopolymer transporter ExbD [Paludibacteraceae bacterium]HOI26960.1 biopolymer transporter ExbD [Paludibacteraceae bacterium]HOU68396.1 biopolymer transporter ExbD [Paludibacteraceae bacterium]HPH62202.1 biopolymer transporter ExbD [Paludibacteraceae bacterium]HQF50266.1 biopolymer transporter ExbD [Paludibacteraceae bacterium]
MAKFRKGGGKKLNAISTASLPDIVFMLLFFFMTTTTMKEVTLKVNQKMPEATELTKMEKKSLVKFIYIGKPKKEFQKAMGTGSRIQLDDAFANDPFEVEQYISRERASMKEEDQGQMIVSLKIDKDTKMGIVTDVKQALRNAYALKISYTATQRVNKYN